MRRSSQRINKEEALSEPELIKGISNNPIFAIDFLLVNF
jgi:phage host-nuclease inhibitor protein Gam